MSTTLAQRLRLLRGEVPQAEFAARVGIHKSSWGRYERGVGEPTGSDLARICAVCGVTPLWLLCGEGAMRAAEGATAAEAAEAAEPLQSDDAPPPVGESCPVPDVPVRMPPAFAPAEEPPASVCRQCRWLEERLEDADRERRELAQENRQLWRENGELRERIARLEERSRHGLSGVGETLPSEP